MVFGKINTEEQQELAQVFGIRSIPTLMVFREQIGVFQQAGALPKPASLENTPRATPRVSDAHHHLPSPLPRWYNTRRAQPGPPPYARTSAHWEKRSM